MLRTSFHIYFLTIYLRISIEFKFRVFVFSLLPFHAHFQPKRGRTEPKLVSFGEKETDTVSLLSPCTQRINSDNKFHEFLLLQLVKKSRRNTSSQYFVAERMKNAFFPPLHSWLFLGIKNNQEKIEFFGFVFWFAGIREWSELIRQLLDWEGRKLNETSKMVNWERTFRVWYITLFAKSEFTSRRKEREFHVYILSGLHFIGWSTI